MMIWLLVILLAYFFFSLSFLGDKLILSEAARPKTYTFYVGVMGALAVFLIPFTSFGLPDTNTLLWIVLEAIVYTAGIYTMFKALEKLEASRVMTTIGAVQPIIILFLTWFFWGFKSISFIQILAFFLLLVGSVLISYNKNSPKTNGYAKIIILSALFFSLDYVFQKFIFLNQPFLQGLIWMRLMGLFLVLFFLFSQKFRKELFAKNHNVARDKKMGTIFICSQLAGGLATILQSFAIFLVPIAFLPIINALRGTQYVFLFLMTLTFSLLFPKILKENTDKLTIIQKIISIAIIAVGLGLVIV